MIDKSRIKLKVVPSRTLIIGTNSYKVNFCISITNLSEFPLTIHEAGLLSKGTNIRLAFVPPILIDGGAWPRRLESRSSVTIYGIFPESSASKVKCASLLSG